MSPGCSPASTAGCRRTPWRRRVSPGPPGPRSWHRPGRRLRGCPAPRRGGAGCPGPSMPSSRYWGRKSGSHGRAAAEAPAAAPAHPPRAERRSPSDCAWENSCQLVQLCHDTSRYLKPRTVGGSSCWSRAGRGASIAPGNPMGIRSTSDRPEKEMAGGRVRVTVGWCPSSSR